MSQFHGRLGREKKGRRSGDRFWGQDERFGGNARRSGGGWLRSRPERVDELEHVVGELTGTVGSGQAFDQFQPPVAVLELEELLAVDRRPHVERAKTLLAGCWVQDDEHARCSLAEIEHRPLEQLGTEVDCDARLPVIPLRIENRPLIGVDGSARAQRRNSLSFEIARNGAARRRRLDSDHCSAKRRRVTGFAACFGGSSTSLVSSQPAHIKSENSWRAGRGISISTSVRSG